MADVVVTESIQSYLSISLDWWITKYTAVSFPNFFAQ